MNGFSEMARTRQGALRGSELRRASVRYHLPNGSASAEPEHLYAELFARDAAEFLFPVDGRVQRQEIFRLSPRDEGVARLVAAGFGGERRLASALSRFAIRAAHRLVLRGRVTFEVAPFSGRERSGRRVLGRAGGVRSELLQRALPG